MVCGAAGCSGSSAAPAVAPGGGTGSADSQPSIVSITAVTATTSPAVALAAAIDSCTAVTQAEAGAALGQSVRAPVMGKATVEGGIACVFYGPSVPVGADPDIPVADSVRVVLVTGTQALTYFTNYKSKVPAQTIAGYGDQAYYDGSASFSVLKGSDYIRIAVIGVPDVLKPEEQLASDALPGM